MPSVSQKQKSGAAGYPLGVTTTNCMEPVCFSFSGYCSVITHGKFSTLELFSRKEVELISSSTAYTDLRKQD